MPASPRPRRRTFNAAGHAHELTFSCFHGYPFLARERVRQWMAKSIDDARNSLGFRLWAYVFMPDHAHLIVQFSQAVYDIARVLRDIKLPVSRQAMAFLRKESPEWLPKLAQTRGTRTEYHFWQRGGGYDRNIIEPSTLQSMMDYVHLNPVRKGLTVRACEWTWSSASVYAGTGPSPLRVDPIPPEWCAGTSR